MTEVQPIHPGGESQPMGEVILEVENTQERFEKELKGRFVEVPKSSYKSNLDGIERFTLVRFPPNDPTEVRVVLNVRNPDNQERRITLNLMSDGVLSGPIPQWLPVNRESILREVLDKIKEAGQGFWHETALDIFPKASQLPEKEEGGEDDGGGSGPWLDESRLAFLQALRKNPWTGFGFISKTKGLDGYRGVIMSSGEAMLGVMDNSWTHNAAFVFGIEVGDEELKMYDPGKLRALTPEQKDEFIERFVMPIFQSAPSKSALVEQGASRVIHTGEWPEKLAEAIKEHGK